MLNECFFFLVSKCDYCMLDVCGSEIEGNRIAHMVDSIYVDTVQVTCHFVVTAYEYTYILETKQSDTTYTIVVVKVVNLIENVIVSMNSGTFIAIFEFKQQLM